LTSLLDRLRHAYNAFSGNEHARNWSVGPGYTARQDRPFLSLATDRSIISTIYNMIAIDVAATPIRHVRVGKNGRYESEIDSGLNECLTYASNVDQVGRTFIQDLVLSLLEDDAAAIVPVDTTLNPAKSDTYDIRSMRVGSVTEWFPKHVKVKLYNEKVGRREEIILPKAQVAIVENPFQEVTNKNNSTLSRLARKLSMLDKADEQSFSGKLDIIIQLPYTIKTEAMQKRAENRRKDIENQLEGSKYGIAYTDGTEKITQLNRAAENNLLEQVKYLTTQVYARLGITEAVVNGTATEEVQTQYWSRTVEPILGAITNAMTTKFLTKTARTRGHRVQYLRDPFRSTAPSKLVESLNTLLQAEVITSNEARSFLSLPPSYDEQADKLQNANINPVGDQNEGEEDEYSDEDDSYYDEGEE